MEPIHPYIWDLSFSPSSIYRYILKQTLKRGVDILWMNEGPAG